MFVKTPGRRSKIKLEKQNLKLFPFDELKKKNLSVEVLSLDHNMISDIPANQMWELSNAWKFSLIHLSICNNGLKNLPREIGTLGHLKILELDNNKLKTLPKDIGKLANLETLSVCHNKLTQLPIEMGQLTNLKKLRISYNDISKIPRSLIHLDKLTVFQYSNNPIVHPPQSVHELGWPAMRLYLAEPLKYVLRKMNPEEREDKKTDKIPRNISNSTSLADLTSEFKIFLGNKTNRIQFMKFLERECSHENLLFWDAVELLNTQHKYLLSGDEDYLVEASKIYNNFLKENAEVEYEVNLPSDIKTKCRLLFSDLIMFSSSKPTFSFRPEQEKPPPSVGEIKQILHECQDSVFQLLALDSYQRFKATATLDR